MTIQVNLLEGNDGIEFLLSGLVSGVDIIRVHRTYHTKAINSLLKYKLIDKSEVTKNDISLGEIQAIADLDKELLRENPQMAIIIVSRREQNVSSTRKWAALLTEGSSQLHFFNSREEADEWISRQYGKADQA